MPNVSSREEHVQYELNFMRHTTRYFPHARGWLFVSNSRLRLHCCDGQVGGKFGTGTDEGDGINGVYVHGIIQHASCSNILGTAYLCCTAVHPRCVDYSASMPQYTAVYARLCNLPSVAAVELHHDGTLAFQSATAPEDPIDLPFPVLAAYSLPRHPCRRMTVSSVC